MQDRDEGRHLLLRPPRLGTGRVAWNRFVPVVASTNTPNSLTAHFGESFGSADGSRPAGDATTSCVGGSAIGCCARVTIAARRGSSRERGEGPADDERQREDLPQRDATGSFLAAVDRGLPGSRDDGHGSARYLRSGRPDRRCFRRCRRCPCLPSLQRQARNLHSWGQALCGAPRPKLRPRRHCRSRRLPPDRHPRRSASAIRSWVLALRSTPSSWAPLDAGRGTRDA